jgi:hypothetical protein
MAREHPADPSTPPERPVGDPAARPPLVLIASPAPSPAAEARRLHPAAAHLLAQASAEVSVPRLRVVPPVAS